MFVFVGGRIKMSRVKESFLLEMVAVKEQGIIKKISKAFLLDA